MTSGQRRAAALLAWVLGLVTLGWLLGASTEQAADVGLAVRDEWRLPSLPTRGLDASRPAVMGAAPYWGMPPETAATAAAVTTPAQPIRWRLAGVVGQGSARRVLVVYSGDPAKASELLNVGDALPTGHLIRRVDDASICVQIGQKSYVLALEPAEAGP